MFYKFIFIILSLFVTNCATNNLESNKLVKKFDNRFVNKGFTLVYDDDLFNQKIISKKINERDLIIFQKSLRKGSKVKVTNILNQKSLIATVGKKSNYPLFNNSVISKRIAKELLIDFKQPYIEIISIPENSMFVAKKTKTFEEEKKVAIKVPVNSISINDLNEVKSVNKKISNLKFSYLIKIADFYFKDTANEMMKRIKYETKAKKPLLKKISDEKYRVYLGPFTDITSLQKTYYDINILNFENIEILKNE
jgi:hypothetical protein